MPHLHGPLEWQQETNRHTRLVDPVLTVRQLSRFTFSLKGVVRIDHALVFSTSGGTYEAYLPPRRPTRGELASKRYTAVYEVDMGVHPFQGAFNSPSDNDAFEFPAEAEISWQVSDPACFVASGHRDVEALIMGELQQTTRPVTRGFAIAENAVAEQELQRHLTGLCRTVGLLVTVTVRLRRDQEDIEHQRRLRAIDHSGAEQIRANRRGMEYDTEFGWRLRRQDELQFERATAYGTQQQQLALQQQRSQHELTVQQEQYQLELRRYEDAKIDFYQRHLEQGGIPALAMHLASHPDDTLLVMNSMRDDQLRLIQSQMHLVTQLLGGDNAEDYELDTPKQLALRTVSDILNQRLPGVVPKPVLPPARGAGDPDPGHDDLAAEDVPARPAGDDKPYEHAPAKPPVAPTPTLPATAPVSSTSLPHPTPAVPSPVPGSLTDWRPPMGYGTAPMLPESQISGLHGPALPDVHTPPTEPTISQDREPDLPGGEP